ncbi:MAG: DNA replication and repair protein RecF [Bradymonadales bacterium]|nr:MAG: DNA replication and repair protein RecF [Bradymonadales bacterium]
MLVTSLKLFQLRRFEFFEAKEFHPQLNVIVGKNAQGKTSILEALSLISQLRSFRSHRLDELVKRGQSQMAVTAVLSKPTHTRVLIGVENGRRVIRVDDKKLQSPAKYPLRGMSVSFVPDDLYLLKGGPEARRDFFDQLAMSLDPTAEAAFKQFHKCLKQRNFLLKRIKEGQRSDRELELWTLQYIESSMRIYDIRRKTISQMAEILRLVYQSLFQLSESVDLSYQHGFEREDFQKEELELRIARRIEAEKATGYSLVGPHRDDIEFLLSEFSVRTYASQGQTRSLVIALKIAQLELIRGTRNIHPLLLLDDIISELDEQRVQALIGYLANYEGQLFVTTAEAHKLRRLHEQFSSFKLIELSGSEKPENSGLETHLNRI